MKKTAIISLLFCLIACGTNVIDPEAAGSKKVDVPNMKTISFSDLKDTAQLDKNIRAFSAVLDFSETQSAADRGISFAIVLEYEGADAIAIHNPLYFLQYVLKGSDKTQQFKGKKAPIPLINRQGPLDETTDFNFDILGILKNGTALTVRDEVNRPTVSFQKGDKQNYRLKISPPTENWSGGDYYLDLLLSIVGSDSSGGAPQSRTLGVQDVAISIKSE
jgi:hypothetical protein